MLLTELFSNTEQSPVEFDFSTANYANNSDQLTYRVTNLPVESSFGDSVISDAGTIILDVDTEDFINKISSKTDSQIKSIDSVKLARPLPNFTHNESWSAGAFNMTSNYVLAVDYTTVDGESETTRVTFDASSFHPSDDFVNQYDDLTS